MKKNMKKGVYVRPETTICEVETDQMMALSVKNGDANPDLESLSNMEKFTDIWGNEY